MLFDAAFTVMQRSGTPDVTVADILQEAGMSTRSFYRHFASKDELLLAMYRREAEAAAERLEAAVEAAASPTAALEAWVDSILGIRYSRRRAARAALLGSASAAKAAGYDDEARHALKLLAEPLDAILEAGRRDGSFPDADPDIDASMIQAVTWAAAGLIPVRDVRPTRDQARAAVMSFCRRALGARM